MVLLQRWFGGSGNDASLQKRTRKKGGWRGLRPWPLRCLSQFLSERKERLLRGRMCCVCLRMNIRISVRIRIGVPFTDGWSCIYSRRPTS